MGEGRVRGLVCGGGDVVWGGEGGWRVGFGLVAFKRLRNWRPTSVPKKNDKLTRGAVTGRPSSNPLARALPGASEAASLYGRRGNTRPCWATGASEAFAESQ